MDWPRKLFNTDSSAKAKSIHELDDATATAVSSIEFGQMIFEGEVTGQICTHFYLFDKNNSPKQRLHNIEISFISGDGQKMSFTDSQKRNEK